MTFLCDRHPEYQLAPAVSDPQRGLFLQWLFFFSSALQNAFSMTYRPNRFATLESAYPSVQQQGCKRLLALWQVVDHAIADSLWMLGESFSAVDIYLFMLSTWLSDDCGHPALAEFANVMRVTDKVVKRPSVRKVYPSLCGAN